MHSIAHFVGLIGLLAFSALAPLSETPLNRTLLQNVATAVSFIYVCCNVSDLCYYVTEAYLYPFFDLLQTTEGLGTVCLVLGCVGMFFHQLGPQIGAIGSAVVTAARQILELFDDQYEDHHGQDSEKLAGGNNSPANDILEAVNALPQDFTPSKLDESSENAKSGEPEEPAPGLKWHHGLVASYQVPVDDPLYSGAPKTPRVGSSCWTSKFHGPPPPHLSPSSRTATAPTAKPKKRLARSSRERQSKRQTPVSLPTPGLSKISPASPSDGSPSQAASLPAYLADADEYRAMASEASDDEQQVGVERWIAVEAMSPEIAHDAGLDADSLLLVEAMEKLSLGPSMAAQKPDQDIMETEATVVQFLTAPSNAAPPSGQQDIPSFSLPNLIAGLPSSQDLPNEDIMETEATAVLFPAGPSIAPPPSGQQTLPSFSLPGLVAGMPIPPVKPTQSTPTFTPSQAARAMFQLQQLFGSQVKEWETSQGANAPSALALPPKSLLNTLSLPPKTALNTLALPPKTSLNTLALPPKTPLNTLALPPKSPPNALALPPKTPLNTLALPSMTPLNTAHTASLDPGTPKVLDSEHPLRSEMEIDAQTSDRKASQPANASQQPDDTQPSVSDDNELQELSDDQQKTPGVASYVKDTQQHNEAEKKARTVPFVQPSPYYGPKSTPAFTPVATPGPSKPAHNPTMPPQDTSGILGLQNALSGAQARAQSSVLLTRPVYAPTDVKTWSQQTSRPDQPYGPPQRPNQSSQESEFESELDSESEQKNTIDARAPRKIAKTRGAHRSQQNLLASSSKEDSSSTGNGHGPGLPFQQSVPSQAAVSTAPNSPQSSVPTAAMLPQAEVPTAPSGRIIKPMRRLLRDQQASEPPSQEDSLPTAQSASTSAMNPASQAFQSFEQGLSQFRVLTRLFDSHGNLKTAEELSDKEFLAYLNENITVLEELIRHVQDAQKSLRTCNEANWCAFFCEDDVADNEQEGARFQLAVQYLQELINDRVSLLGHQPKLFIVSQVVYDVDKCLEEGKKKGNDSDNEETGINLQADWWDDEVIDAQDDTPDDLGKSD